MMHPWNRVEDDSILSHACMQGPAGAFGDTFSGFSEWTKTLGLIKYPALIADLQS